MLQLISLITTTTLKQFLMIFQNLKNVHDTGRRLGNVRETNKQGLKKYQMEHD